MIAMTTQSQLRYLSVNYVQELFCIHFICIISFNPHYKPRMCYHFDAAASIVASIQNGPQDFHLTV